MSPDSALQASQLLQVAAALFLALRLGQFGLIHHLRAMFALQVWTIVSSVGTFLLYSHPRYYFRFYGLAIPIAAAVDIFAVNELFAMVFNHYPGIRTVGRWMMYCGVALSVSVSVLQARLFWPKNLNVVPPLAWLEVTQRSVVFSLAVFILCILFFLSRYPLYLPRNFSVSSSLFCTIFLTETCVLLFDTASPHLHNAYVDLLQMFISTFCIVCWGILLKPMSSPAQQPAAPAGDVHEQVLLAELENLNKLMTRAARR